MSIKQRIKSLIVKNRGEEFLKVKTFLGSVDDILDLYSNLFDTKTMKFLEKIVREKPST